MGILARSAFFGIELLIAAVGAPRRIEHEPTDDQSSARPFTGNMTEAKRAAAANAPLYPEWMREKTGQPEKAETPPGHPNTPEAEDVAQPEKVDDRYVIVRESWQDVKP